MLKLLGIVMMAICSLSIGVIGARLKRVAATGVGRNGLPVKRKVITLSYISIVIFSILTMAGFVLVFVG